MSDTDDDTAHRDAYVREYYGRRWYWTSVGMAIVVPAMLFCAAITPEGNFDNLLVMFLVLAALQNVFWFMDLRRVTKKYFPPKR